MPRITTHSKQREFTSPQNVPYCPCFSKIQFSSLRKAAALWWSPYIDFPFSEPIKWESNVCNLLGSGLFYWRKCSYSFINRFFFKKKKLLIVWKGHLCFMKIDLTFILPNFYCHQQFISGIFLFCFAFTLVRISIV